jgi:hypothetical protein
VVDEWGTALALSLQSNGLLITSAGPDGKFGTADDIVSPPGVGVLADTFDVAQFCELPES